MKKGFTLIELMVVIVIVVILAAIVIPKVYSITHQHTAQMKGYSR
jgi:prepilin-type N-terminal cleavage/methylation domain-containing protein